MEAGVQTYPVPGSHHQEEGGREVLATTSKTPGPAVGLPTPSHMSVVGPRQGNRLPEPPTALVLL